MPEVLLGLDLGTTRVCALAIDLEGRVRGRAYQSLATAYPSPGRVEQDPEEMLAKSVLALHEARTAAGAGARDVRALGLAAQRATALAWDARSGQPLAPAIGWQDQRGAARAAELRREGFAVTPLASATKLESWLRGQDAAARAVQAAARAGSLRLGTPDAWLGFRLGAARQSVTDPGHASCTGLYDLETGDWSDRALARFGVPREALPEVTATACVADQTDPTLIGVSVPLAARAGDQQAAAFAQGAHVRGAAKLTLGTAAMLDVHAGEGGRELPSAPGAHPLALWRLAEGERDALCLEGTAITAGAALDWLARLGVLPEAEQLDALAAPSSGGAWFVPALQGLGTPHMDFAARGVLGGLSLATGRPELARAALEGVAQRGADLCEALGFADSVLPIDGGLARSDLMLQLLADLTGAEVRRAAEVETTAFGAAQLAGLAVGALPDLAACRALAAPAVRLLPRLDDAARAEERERWRERVTLAAGRGAS
jgi:glycerol kinase